MNLGALSDRGRVRKDNEDSFYVSEENDKLKVYLIADGIGGQNHGKLASMMTIKNVVEYMRENTMKNEAIFNDSSLYSGLGKKQKELLSNIFNLIKEDLEEENSIINEELDLLSNDMQFLLFLIYHL